MAQRITGRALQRRRNHYFQEYPLCVECERQGRVKPGQELDHIVPLSKGGADEPDNWQGLCTDCHKVKTAKDMGHKPKGCDVSGRPTSPDHWWNG